MINIYPGDLEKIQLLDKCLRAITVDDVRALVEGDLVAGKLRGDAITPYTPGPIQAILDAYNKSETELAVVRGELWALKDDFTNLLRTVNRLANPAPTYISELNNLKNKHGVY